MLWYVFSELLKGQKKEIILAYKGCGHDQTNIIVWQHKFVIGCVPMVQQK